MRPPQPLRSPVRPRPRSPCGRPGSAAAGGVSPRRLHRARGDGADARRGQALHADPRRRRRPPAPLPILLERTPYDATRALGGRRHHAARGAARGDATRAAASIFVVQDLRGRFKSEGDYAMYRVPRGAFNRTETDETTDAWDTIDWLVKNVTPNNGRVGVWGTSYPGWLTLAALRDPHPALAAAVPFNPVVDVWKADDWFHWGAFRPAYAFDFIYAMETRKGASVGYPYETRDLYTWHARARARSASLGRAPRRAPRDVEAPDGVRRATGPTGRTARPTSGSTRRSGWCRRCTSTASGTRRTSTARPRRTRALEAHDRGNDTNFFAAGPWYHGQHFADGSAARARSTFDEDTAEALPRGRARAVPAAAS